MKLSELNMLAKQMKLARKLDEDPEIIVRTTGEPAGYHPLQVLRAIPPGEGGPDASILILETSWGT